MASVHNVDLSIWHVAAIGLRLGRVKRSLILAPDHEETRLVFSHPGLPFGIGLGVGAVIVEWIALNFSLAGPIQEVKLIRPKIRIVALKVGIVSDVSRSRRSQR